MDAAKCCGLIIGLVSVLLIITGTLTAIGYGNQVHYNLLWQNDLQNCTIDSTGENFFRIENSENKIIYAYFEYDIPADEPHTEVVFERDNLPVDTVLCAVSDDGTDLTVYSRVNGLFLAAAVVCSVFGVILLIVFFVYWYCFEKETGESLLKRTAGENNKKGFLPLRRDEKTQ